VAAAVAATGIDNALAMAPAITPRAAGPPRRQARAAGPASAQWIPLTAAVWAGEGVGVEGVAAVDVLLGHPHPGHLLARVPHLLYVFLQTARPPAAGGEGAAAAVEARLGAAGSTNAAHTAQAESCAVVYCQ
jgi:hypothetical protein